MSQRLLLVVLTALFLAVACRSKGVLDDGRPVRFIGNLQSFESPMVVRSRLDSGLSWVVKEDSKVPRLPDRPPFDFFVVRVKGFKEFGHTGELELTFFNERLMEAAFRPDDADGFLRSLNDVARVNLKKDDKKRLSQNLELLAHTREKGEVWIRWQDLRLTKEVDEWVSKYS
jgi:hypothetical protein